MKPANRTPVAKDPRATQLALFDDSELTRAREQERSSARVKPVPAPEEHIHLLDRPIGLEDCELIRSRRKTLSLVVRNAKLVVRAPLRAPQYWIREVIASKQAWIHQQIDSQLQQREEVIRILDRGTLCINGKIWRVCFDCSAAGAHTKIARNNKCGKLLAKDQVFHISFPSGVANADKERLATNLFLSWLKKNASDLLNTYVKRLCEQQGFNELLKGINYRITRSKWGHCASNGEIQLNPVIALAPESVRDYVITHELCHLRHRNHSARFWSLVEKHDPNWQAAEQWLGEQGHRVAVGSLLSAPES